VTVPHQLVRAEEAVAADVAVERGHRAGGEHLGPAQLGSSSAISSALTRASSASVSVWEAPAEAVVEPGEAVVEPGEAGWSPQRLWWGPQRL